MPGARTETRTLMDRFSLGCAFCQNLKKGSYEISEDSAFRGQRLVYICDEATNVLRLPMSPQHFSARQFIVSIGPGNLTPYFLRVMIRKPTTHSVFLLAWS
jgi:hypothetical protein